jgi:hypothetical protein
VGREGGSERMVVRFWVCQAFYKCMLHDHYGVSISRCENELWYPEPTEEELRLLNTSICPRTGMCRSKLATGSKMSSWDHSIDVHQTTHSHAHAVFLRLHAVFFHLHTIISLLAIISFLRGIFARSRSIILHLQSINFLYEHVGTLLRRYASTL